MAKAISVIRRDVSKAKSALIKKALKRGLYENFGQKEIRKLQDKYGYIPEVERLDDWAMNFDMSQLQRERAKRR